MQSDALPKTKSKGSRAAAKRSVGPADTVIRFSAPYVRSLLETIEGLERQRAIDAQKIVEMEGTIDQLRAEAL